MTKTDEILEYGVLPKIRNTLSNLRTISGEGKSKAQCIAQNFAKRFVAQDRVHAITFMSTLPHVDSDTVLVRLSPNCELVACKDVAIESMNMIVLEGRVRCVGVNCYADLGVGQSALIPTECSEGIYSERESTILLIAIGGDL